MTDNRTISTELANALQATQEQLRETRRFQEQTLTAMSQMQTKLEYQQSEVLRLAQVVSADNEKSLVTRLHLLERMVADLTANASSRADRGWEVKAIVIGALVTTFIGWAMQGFPGLKPEKSPEPPPLEDPWQVPGPGEESGTKI